MFDSMLVSWFLYKSCFQIMLLNALGFSERIKGDHFIYSKIGVAEIVNLQPLGGKAKAYQVKQVRNLILKYKLAR